MSPQPSPLLIARLKFALLVACLMPAVSLAWNAWRDALGANPAEAITRHLGDWTLDFLLLTLTVTPLRRYTGWAWLIRLRRTLGLATFFYACLHVASYLGFDQSFDLAAVARDILKRPFIAAGFVAFALQVPLAATSSNAMVRRLGGRRWQALHRSIYAIAIIGVLHYAWMVKRDLAWPLAYAAAVVVLLGLRAWWREQERRRQLAGAYAPKPKGRIIPIIAKR
jgi:sulfoxide reductase heme-binding subunit YedZ